MSYQNQNQSTYGNPNVSNRQLIQQNQTVPYSYGVQQNPVVPQNINIPQNQGIGYLEPQQRDQHIAEQLTGFGKKSAYLSNSYYAEDPNAARPIQYMEESVTQNRSQKTERIINWFAYVWPILFLIVTLVLMSQILYTHQQKLHNPEEDKGILSFVISNLQQTPIADIVSIESPVVQVSANHNKHSFSHHISHILHNEVIAHTCPEGYQVAALGSWSGVKSGCLCEDGTKHSRVYCTFHTDGKCKTVRSVDSQFLKQWRNQKVCVKTVSNWKWVGSEQCKDGFKTCQPGLCVSSTDNCPLSSLTEITELQAPSTRFIKIASKYYEKKNSVDLQPFIGFSVTPGVETNAPCYNQELSPTFQSTKYYPLANQPQIGCVDQVSGYRFQVDTLPIKDVYSQNQLVETQKNIPYYDAYIVPSDTLNLQLLQRIKIGGDAACNTLNSKNLNTVLLRSSQLYSSAKWVSIVVISLCSIGLFVAMVLFIMRGRQMDTGHMNNFHQTKLIYIFAVVAAIFSIFLCSVYIHHVDNEDGLKDLHIKFQNYIKKQCFVEQPIANTLTSIDKFSLDTYSKTEQTIKVSFGVSIVFLVVALVTVAIQHFHYNEPWCQDPWKSL